MLYQHFVISEIVMYLNVSFLTHFFFNVTHLLPYVQIYIRTSQIFNNKILDYYNNRDDNITVTQLTIGNKNVSSQKIVETR